MGTAERAGSMKAPSEGIDSSLGRSKFSQREEREALARVLESKHFAKAPLLSAFLTYACEAALGDESARLTEQEIGVRVFRRPEGYDPGEDNIVRNYARQLRRRLDAYYQEEGRTDPLRIEMPKGGYAANFSPAASGATASRDPVGFHEAAVESRASIADETMASRTVEARPSAGFDAAVVGKRRFWIPILCSFLIGALAVLAAWRIAERPARSPLHPLWSLIFQADRDTVVVPADVGFVILQQLNNRTFSLAEYESWSPVEQYDHVYMSFLKAQKYTSMLDLETVSRLQHIPEVVPSRFSARAARSLGIEDLNNDNVILLGSNYSNPWMEIFERSLNFHFVNDPKQGRSWIENTHPRAGEAARYENTTRNITHETYGVVALLPNLSKSGHVLVVEGLDGPGTQAVVDLLLNGDALAPVLRHATRPDGTLGNFEALVAATSVDTRATGAHILAERYYP
jgi:hypothetical protein